MTEETPPGDDFLAQVCVAWEREAAAAEELGVRVVRVRTGVVLDKGGGALAKMLPFFKLGVGGPVAGGRQYLPWIHVDDLVGALPRRARRRRLAGPGQRDRARRPSRTRTFSRALGRALHRPAFAPVPGLAVRVLYGEMADIVVHGQRAVPERPLALGHRFRAPGTGRGVARRVGRLTAAAKLGVNRHMTTGTPVSVSAMSHFDIRVERPAGRPARIPDPRGRRARRAPARS